MSHSRTHAPEPHPVQVLGILGAVGAGKSAVAHLLAERGAVVLDADALAHQAYRDPSIRAAVRARFGPAAVSDQGEPDRELLGEQVFSSSSARLDLEGILHPWVRARLRSRAEKARSDGAPLVVYDVPLLAESPLQQDCDAFLAVEASEAVRRQRVRDRGWTDQELARREACQWPLEEKIAVAGPRPVWRLRNDGDRADLARAVAVLWEEIVAFGRAPSGP